MEAIVAYDKNRLIGLNEKIPWTLKNDMEHFYNYTKDKTVVMGRKTFDSIGKPLTNRINIIMTKNKDLIIDDCLVYTSIHDVLTNYPRSIVIGGESIYKLFFPYIKIILASEIDIKIKEEKNKSSFFPFINPDEWKIKSLFKHEANNIDQYSFTIKRYTKYI